MKDTSPVSWSWNHAESMDRGHAAAIFYVVVPENKSLDPRPVSAQISIDNNDVYGFAPIDETDEHDWGEWITILDGVQLGW